MNKDFKFICNDQEQIFGAVMRVHDSIREQMILLSQSFKQIIYFCLMKQVWMVHIKLDRSGVWFPKA